MKRTFILSTVILAGCAALPTIQSVPHTDESISGYQGYDKNSGIRYHVADDSDHLYLTLNTAEPASIMKILHGGLTVYFDEKGKKHKDIYLEYPLPQSMEGANGEDRQSFARSGFARDQSEKEEPPVMPVSTEMLLVRNGEKLSLDNRTENVGISVRITPGREELTYALKIPLREILTEKDQVDALALGIVSGDSGTPSGGVPSPGTPGGGPGGRPPMGDSGGMPGGDRGPQGGTMTQSGSGISFWFRVKL